MRFILYTTIVLLAIFIFGAPTPVQAADIYLPAIDGNIFINSQIYIRADDTLRIPLGSKVYFGEHGSIYAQGNIFIGLNSTSTSVGELTNPTNTVYMSSQSSRYALQIDGGNLLALNIKFEGNLFLEGYRGADISISNSHITDTRSKLTDHKFAIISIYGGTKFEISHSSIISKVPDAYIRPLSKVLQLIIMKTSYQVKS